MLESGAGTTRVLRKLSVILVILTKFSRPPGGSDDEGNTKTTLCDCPRGSRDVRSCASHGNQSELPAGALLGTAFLCRRPAGLVGGARAQAGIQHFPFGGTADPRVRFQI